MVLTAAWLVGCSTLDESGSVSRTGTSTTTSPTTISDASTTTSSGSATTTDATTTNGSTAEASSAGGIITSSFITDPDGGERAFECSTWEEDCPRGEKRMPWANDGGNAWNAPPQHEHVGSCAASRSFYRLEPVQESVWQHKRPPVDPPRRSPELSQAIFTTNTNDTVVARCGDSGRFSVFWQPCAAAIPRA